VISNEVKNIGIRGVVWGNWRREKELTSPEVTTRLERSREEMQQVVLSSWPLSRRGLSLSFGTAFSAMDAISASLN